MLADKHFSPWIALSAALLLASPVAVSAAKAQNSTVTKPAAKTAVKTSATKTPAVKPLTERQKIVHALNRLAFGPRPGDIERVQKMGLQKWIDAQLQPQNIDDSALERKLRALSTLQMSASQLTDAYEADQLFRREMALMRQQRNANQTPRMQPAADGQMAANDAMPAMENATPNPANRDRLNPRQQRQLEEARAMGLERGVSVLAVGELVNAKIVRAVESERQLHEVLVDFWSNHFNVDVKKGPVRTYKISDERDVIRPHVWGKFRDLLGASAKSPAMLIYLDNARSTAEMEMPARGRFRNANRNNANGNNASTRNAQPAPTRRIGGLNENYGRELLELHTMGVNGGYTQKDVQEVARCLTGWGVNRQTGEFQFRRAAHDNGEKTVLGQKIPAGGGIADGERVLDLLARHPSTAKFIARKLCVRLVSDNPPTALVQKAAETFTRTDGDLRAVVSSIVKAPEFWSAPVAKSKIKSPFEFAVSSVRALDGTILLAEPSQPRGRVQLVADGAASNGGGGGGQRNARTLAREIAQMGQPLYSYQAPTGYPENSQSWVSAGALVARLNFALSLTSGQLVNVAASPGMLVEGVDLEERDAILERLAQALLGGEMSAATRATLKAQMPTDAPVDVRKLAALLLGSPEFQRR